MKAAGAMHRSSGQRPTNAVTHKDAAEVNEAQEIGAKGVMSKENATKMNLPLGNAAMENSETGKDPRDASKVAGDADLPHHPAVEQGGAVEPSTADINCESKGTCVLDEDDVRPFTGDQQA